MRLPPQGGICNAARQPFLPPERYRFIDEEYMIISYRTDFVIEPIAGNDLRDRYSHRYHARA